MMKWLREILAAAVVLALATLPVCTAASPPSATNEPKTVVVLNFADTEGNTNASLRWLSKGLADLLITDLTAGSPRLRVVTRENMQTLLQEAELADKTFGHGGMPDEAAEALRKYVTVDHLVFGTYALRNRRLTLTARVIAQDNGLALAECSAEGDLDRALDLERSLAEKLLAFWEGGKAEAPRFVLPRWTDSLPAAQHLYEGIDAFDNGRFTAAWYEFKQALRTDPAYADARYWLARMHYYRQEYEHASIEYGTFIRQAPWHGRAGDAVMEYVHSRERTSNDPQTLLALYRSLRAGDWRGTVVHNQLGYVSTSPLADWLLKREETSLAYLGERETAFRAMHDEIAAAMRERQTAPWTNDSARLMAELAELNEDTGRERLDSPYLPYMTHVLSTNGTTVGEDMTGGDLCGRRYLWGLNHRILAPPGTCITGLTACVERTDDPWHNSVCRLQIRRYRYVDIDTCWTGNKSPPCRTNLFRVNLPPGCTWFYLRPEFYGIETKAPTNRPPPSVARFDGWWIKADLAPLGETGRLAVRVDNCANHRTLVDDRYARSYDGDIANLSTGMHRIVVENLWGKNIGYAPFATTVVVRAGQNETLRTTLPLSAAGRALGWGEPFGVANLYPTFKLRPPREDNWRDGHPSMAFDRRTERAVVVWAHRDDLWVSVSTNGVPWSPPASLAPPVNSAHVEVNPRLILDEQGRYCLLFQSDRGMHRGLASYAAWSRDLGSWSRPVMVSPGPEWQQDMIQALDGTYVVICTAHSRGPGWPSGLMIRRSSDLVAWSKPIDCSSAIGNPQTMCLRQDSQGSFHLAYVQGGAMPGRVRAKTFLRHYVSNDLLHWRYATRVETGLKIIEPVSLSAVCTADSIYVGIGGSDEMYGSAERFSLLRLPLRMSEITPQYAALPPGVVDGLCDVAAGTDKNTLTLVWQTGKSQLSELSPSGPVLGMSGTPCAFTNAPMEKTR